MQRIPLGFPAKENHPSPTKRGKTTTLNELINFIKTSGVNLTPAIAKIVTTGSNPESPLKQLPSNRQTTEDSKKLKIELTDAQFEYKKLEEDFAEFKRSSKIEREKESKKQEEAIVKLRSTLEYSTEDGLYTIAKLKQDHQEEVSGLKERSAMELQQEKTAMVSDYENKLGNQEKVSTRQMAELKKEHQKAFNDKVRTLQGEIQELKVTATRETKDVAIKNKQTLEDKERRHESIRVAIESQKKTEEKLHEKTKLDSSKQKEKLISELCYERNMKLHLEQTVQSREKQIRKLKHTISDKEDEIVLLQEKTTRKLSQKQVGFEQKVKELQSFQASQIRVMNEKYISEIEQFETRIEKNEGLKKEKDELAKGNFEELSALFEKRPSRKEDLNELEKMKWALARREEEIRKLSKDIRYCNLELQNKEDLYTRMFRGNSMSRDKKQRQKQDNKEHHFIEDKLCKETVYRRSQTSDIKFLLKMYNNKQ